MFIIVAKSQRYETEGENNKLCNKLINNNKNKKYNNNNNNDDVDKYLKNICGLFNFFYNSILGPTGLHHYFLSLNIDSITIKPFNKNNNNNEMDKSVKSLYYIIMELIYTSNNLHGKYNCCNYCCYYSYYCNYFIIVVIEELHHSYFLYILIGHDKFAVSCCCCCYNCY